MYCTVPILSVEQTRVDQSQTGVSGVDPLHVHPKKTSEAFVAAANSHMMRSIIEQKIYSDDDIRSLTSREDAYLEIVDRTKSD